MHSKKQTLNKNIPVTSQILDNKLKKLKTEIERDLELSRLQTENHVDEKINEFNRKLKRIEKLEKHISFSPNL